MFRHPCVTALRPVAAVVAFVCTSAASLPALAAEPFEIKDIRIEGLQRGDPGTVFGALPFRIGDSYSDEKGATALRALFATGLFKDVRVDVDGQTVVVVVEERPIVASVNFVGLKEFDKDVILKALKENGIGEGQPFDKAVVDRAEQEIKRQYLTRSLYGAEVVTTATPADRNRVNVTFTIVEGDVARIDSIRILGSQAYSESDLRDLMDLSTSGWLSWYTKNDRYSRVKLNGDIEKIRSFYLNRGYLEFDVTGTEVTISPDKQAIALTLTVHEGRPYTLTAVELDGDYLGQRENFERLVRVKVGQPYKGDDVTATTRAFNELYGTYGYAFARVDAQPQLDRENAQVKLVLTGQPQQRVNVRRINLSGNTVTRDEVIRREFRQFESAWYDGDKIKLSRDRVERLGFFDEVSVDTHEVAGSPDQVDLTYTLKEKPTGSFQIAAGYSRYDKLALSASITKENIFGTGNYLGLSVNTSRNNRALAVSTIDPYFTEDGVSRAVDVYYRTSRPLNSLGDAYQLATQGLALRFGVPFSEYDTVFFGAGLEQTVIGTSAGVPNSYFQYAEIFGRRSMSFPLTVGWAREERDNPQVPTKGRYQRVNLDFSVLGDVRYGRLNAQYQEYYPLGDWVPLLSNRFTLGINAEVGWGFGLSGKPFPIFKNFYGGGLGTVRGFAQSSFGGVDITGAYDGGNRRINLNSELYLPVPGTGNDKSLRIFLFGDAGNVWREDVKMKASDLRASVGFGVSWISPVGPLKLSYGIPVRALPGDKIERFQFQIGTAF